MHGSDGFFIILRQLLIVERYAGYYRIVDPASTIAFSICLTLYPRAGFPDSTIWRRAAAIAIGC